jgi:hypothetical protein
LATVRPADLANWTPVALNLATEVPSIDWGDLRGVRFAEPFFHQTVERWAGANPAPLVRTDLAALAQLDDQPSLDPSALIFHLSRCGSTLLSRLLGIVPGMLVVSEPAPINTLLLAAREDDEAARALRLLVRALGRRRFGDERHYVLKLSSWNVLRFEFFRRAFPSMPVIWLQRAPVEVMASLLARLPGWLDLLHHPREAEALFGPGIDPAQGCDAFAVRALRALLRAARDMEPAQRLDLDYRELPDAIWHRVAPFLGLSLEPGDIARMREASRYHSKEVLPTQFAGNEEEKRPVPAPLRAMIEAELDPLYRVLGRDLAAAACL